MNRILVADDSSTIHKVIKIALAGQDYEIVEAASLVEALAVGQRLKPAAMIVDARLPGVKSPKDLASLAQDAGDVPVLLLVGTFDAVNEQEFRDFGFQLFLRKPFDSADLAGMVATMFGASPGLPPPMPSGGLKLAAKTAYETRGDERIPPGRTSRPAHQTVIAPPGYTFVPPSNSDAGQARPATSSDREPGYGYAPPDDDQDAAWAAESAVKPVHPLPPPPMAVRPSAGSETQKPLPPPPSGPKTYVDEQAPAWVDHPTPPAFDEQRRGRPAFTGGSEEETARPAKRPLAEQPAPIPPPPKGSEEGDDAASTNPPGPPAFGELKADILAKMQPGASAAARGQGASPTPPPPPRVHHASASTLEADLPRLVREAVEAYCDRHFKSLAREMIAAELRRLTEEKARHLVDQ